ncbi:MAG: hypothetical protein IVW57_03710 [Ktedonobacterales bacterium]|nr:hypothetical protein [Ktedonobacterales bacterium]
MESSTPRDRVTAPPANEDATLPLRAAPMSAAPVRSQPVWSVSPPTAPGTMPNGPRLTDMLAQPFPLSFTVAVPVGLAVALGIAYGAEEGIFGGDWSAGALAVGIAALLMAAGTLGMLALRFALGRRAVSTLALALTLTLALVGGGAVSLAAVTPLHTTQARALERQRQWLGAIKEFALAGQSAPRSTDIARVYDEWGEDLLARQSYAQAISTFNTVILGYAQSGDSVTRARKDLYQTYDAWVKAGAPGLPLAQAVNVLTTYRGSASCDATCKTSSAGLEAQVRYQFGLQLMGAGQLPDAIVQFELVQSRFTSSPYAAKSHTAAAKSYLAVGKKQLGSGACSIALPIYQKLASSYSDTPEGGQAKTALAGPVTVSGKLTNFPTAPAPDIYLSQQYDVGSYYYSNDYTAKFDANTGVFTFSGVAQGTYYLDTIRNLGATIEYNLYQDKATGNPYAVKIGPLCQVDLGSITYA